MLRRAETPGRMCALVHVVPSSVVDKSRILFHLVLLVLYDFVVYVCFHFS